MSEEDNKASQDETLDAEQLANEVAGDMGDQDLADEWAAAMEEAGETGDGDDAQPAEMQDFEQPTSFSKEANLDNPDLDVILDIPVTISMEVGNTSIPIRNLLQLNQGSVIELDRLAGEPLDVLVNGTLIAHGEVVMVNEKFGIRLTDVVSQQERINRLR